MTDLQTLADAMTMEKKLSANYDLFASECADVSLRDTALKALLQSHQVQTELYETIVNRGWRPRERATEEQVRRVREKFLPREQQG